ncbi:MAG: hypothetical protein ACAI25_10130 [Planctomycetota bacterium]
MTFSGNGTQGGATPRRVGGRPCALFIVVALAAALVVFVVLLGCSVSSDFNDDVTVFMGGPESMFQVAAFENLWTLATAEDHHRKQFGVFGTRDELIAAGLIPTTFNSSMRRYYFSVSVDFSTRNKHWSVFAAPARISRRTPCFFMDESKALYAGSYAPTDTCKLTPPERFKAVGKLTDYIFKSPTPIVVLDEERGSAK